MTNWRANLDVLQRLVKAGAFVNLQQIDTDGSRQESENLREEFYTELIKALGIQYHENCSKLELLLRGSTYTMDGQIHAIVIAKLCMEWHEAMTINLAG